MNRTNTNGPEYYKSSTGVEAIDVIDAFNLNFNLGNVIKYVLRAGKKPETLYVDDLQKAKYYIEREIHKAGGYEND